MRSYRPPAKFNPHPFAYHEEIEIPIRSLTNQGVGVGTWNDWVVFVPFSLPNEMVRARIYRNHANYSEADLMEVLVPSPERVSPVCPLFTECGGCQYQHASYSLQLQWKRQQVEELLNKMLHLQFPVSPVLPSPKPFHYRSKITPHFDKPKPPEKPAIGFLRHGRRNQIVDIPQCPLATEEINARLPEVRQKVFQKLDQYRSGSTLLFRQSSDGNVETDPKATVRECVNGISFQFPAGAFFQNNPFILPSLVDFVAEQAAVPGIRYLVDTYCGSGLFSLCCAHHFEQVFGIEISEAAILAAQANAEANQISNCHFIANDASTIFEGLNISSHETAVIIDPPRKGCDENFLNQLFSFRPARVIYISCNPATQIRDLDSMLKSGYSISQIQPFDLFPQTKHLECVVVLQASN